MKPEDFRIRSDWYFPYSENDLIRFGYRPAFILENKPTARCTNLKLVTDNKNR